MTPAFDVIVLGRARAAAVVAAEAACGLAARASSRTAIVVTAGPPPGVAASTALPAALRARDRLRARDLDARASGRLVWCAVPDSHAADRAAGVGLPVVLAVCGPRTAWTDELLAEAGGVLLAGDPADPVTELALEDLRARGLHVTVVAPPAGVRAGLARLGLARGLPPAGVAA